MAFWQDSPSTNTPRNSENLSRAEKYLTATAGSNGDFYVDIDGASTLATNDIVKIAFPEATNGTSNARLSIDGGTTYKNIQINNIDILARNVESCNYELRYNGTQWTFLKNTKVELFNFAKPHLNLGFSGGVILGQTINFGINIQNMNVIAVLSQFETDLPFETTAFAVSPTLRFGFLSSLGSPPATTISPTIFSARFDTSDYQSYNFGANARVDFNATTTSYSYNSQEANRSIMLSFLVVAN